MFWSLVRPDRILLPITRSAAVTTSLEAGELAVVMITCGGRNRGRMTHDGQRCERILRHLPPCHCGLCCFMADPKRKPRQSDVDRDTGERRRQEEALDEALKNTFPASDPVSVEQPTTSGRAYRSLTPFMADGAAVVFTSPADSTYWPAARACKILHPPQPYDGGKHQEDDKKKRNPLQFLLPSREPRCRIPVRPRFYFARV